MPAKFYVSLALSVAIWFLAAATVSFFVIWRNAMRAEVQPLRKPSALVLVLALLIVGYVAFYLQFRFVWFTIAASHVLDINPPFDRWLTWFFWATYALPVSWSFSVVCAAREYFGRRRYLRVILYGVTSPGVAALYFICWQIYLACLP